MTRAARRIGAVCVLALSGCFGGTQQPPPPGCFTGDPALAPELTLVYQEPGGKLGPITDGTMVPLVVPPQGAEILVIGVRAVNIDGCPLTMSTSLIVPSSGAVAAFDRRPVTLQAADDGWLEPKNPTGLANFSNLPACPIAGLGQAVDGESYELSVQIEDLAGHKGQASATIVPTCDNAANPTMCQCLCAAGYVLGSHCP